MSPWLIGAICLVVGANLGAIVMGILAAGAMADKRMPRPGNYKEDTDDA